MTILEIITLLIATVGVLFLLLSSIGILRLPDLYTRMHAAGKSSTIGTIGVLIAVAFYFADLVIAGKMVALIIFLWLTAPVAAHMLDRAAFLTGVKPLVETKPNDLQGAYDVASRRLRSAPADAHQTDASSATPGNG